MPVADRFNHASHRLSGPRAMSGFNRGECDSTSTPSLVGSRWLAKRQLRRDHDRDWAPVSAEALGLRDREADALTRSAARRRSGLAQGSQAGRGSASSRRVWRRRLKRLIARSTGLRASRGHQRANDGAKTKSLPPRLWQLGATHHEAAGADGTPFGTAGSRKELMLSGEADRVA
jgi:hypothetical protein